MLLTTFELNVIPAYDNCVHEEEKIVSNYIDHNLTPSKIVEPASLANFHLFHLFPVNSQTWKMVKWRQMRLGKTPRRLNANDSSVTAQLRSTILQRNVFFCLARRN